MSELSANRKEANWNAICNGRDLLAEIEQKEKNFRMEMEMKIREETAKEILNGKWKNRDYVKPPLTAGDTLDWT